MTSTRTRYAIAMTVVMSAALCADRVTAAAPQQRPQPASVASRVMDRLSLSLRRVVPSIKVIETRREDRSVETIAAVPEPLLVAQQPISPFQFRLPPPLA